MDAIKEKKRCTSEKKKVQDKWILCGEPLLLVMGTDGKEGAYICPDCDGLEYFPANMRERIFEQ